MLLNGIDFTIVGVAPESFTGLDQFFHPAFFVPAMMAPALDKVDGDLLTDRANRAFAVKGRVKPGVSLRAANGEASALANAFAQSFPKTDRGFGAVVRTEMQARLKSKRRCNGGGIAVRARWGGVADRLCQHCQFAAGPRTGASARVGCSCSHWRQPGTLVGTLLAECNLIALGGCVLRPLSDRPGGHRLGIHREDSG